MAREERALLRKAVPVSGFLVDRVCFDGEME